MRSGLEKYGAVRGLRSPVSPDEPRVVQTEHSRVDLCSDNTAYVELDQRLGPSHSVRVQLIQVPEKTVAYSAGRQHPLQELTQDRRRARIHGRPRTLSTSCRSIPDREHDTFTRQPLPRRVHVPDHRHMPNRGWERQWRHSTITTPPAWRFVGRCARRAVRAATPTGRPRSQAPARWTEGSGDPMG